MNAATHAVFGIAAFAGAGLATGNEPALYAYPVAMVAAWLPDVDNPRSRLGNGLSRRRNSLSNSVTRPLSWALRIASFALARTAGHRTVTHSLLGLAVLVLAVSPLWVVAPDVSLALLAGCASHIAADALNTRGVPLLWPLRTPFRLLPGGVRSGGVVEFVIALAIFALAGYELYLLHPPLARSLEDLVSTGVL